jgi:hypothetical protein
MIDVKQAVLSAKRNAAEILGETSFSLEEIEREVYKGHDVWSITLSMPREPILFNALSHYKRFLIDVETGEMLGMVVREFASR